MEYGHHHEKDAFRYLEDTEEHRRQKSWGGCYDGAVVVVLDRPLPKNRAFDFDRALVLLASSSSSSSSYLGLWILYVYG